MSWFALKDCIDRGLFKSFNALSDAWLLARTLQRRRLSFNRVYRDRYLGQRCFIIGTGPSLNHLTPRLVDALSHEVMFGVNFLYRAEAVLALKPQFYVLIDTKFRGSLAGIFEEVCDRYKAAPPVIIADIRASRHIPKEVARILVHARHYPVDSIRCNLDCNLSITGNVVGTAILSAIYMGFREVFLLGCDYNGFCNPQGIHCYRETNAALGLPTHKLGLHLKEYAFTTHVHYLIAELARRSSIRVVNATEGSLLDAYPRIALADILS